MGNERTIRSARAGTNRETKMIYVIHYIRLSRSQSNFSGRNGRSLPDSPSTRPFPTPPDKERA